MTFTGSRTAVQTVTVVGDDTGYIHVGPNHTLEMTDVSPYRRINITFAPYIYQEAKWILPKAMVEFRQPLDEKSKGMSSSACDSGLLRNKNHNIWGTMSARKAHILIGTGNDIVFFNILSSVITI